MLGTVLGYVYGVTLGLDVGTDLGSLDGLFDGSNDAIYEILLLRDSLGSTDSKVLGYNEGNELVTTYDKCLGTILEKVYGIILVIDIGIEQDFF